MQCPQCQHENPPQAKFCLECGARQALTCSNCRAELPGSAKFCLECGEPVGPHIQTRSPDSYTPKHLAEKILTSKAALEGERKQVTVLFSDLKGSTELLADRDPEEARKLLDPVLEHMMEAVHRYEGTVNQVMGDGIMALFGAPLAQEDHAIRACYAALRMQETVKRYAEDVRRSHGVTIQIRVGLNSGEVVVRSIGNDLHMDYTAVGQTTHLAARMEQLATPGSILLAPATLGLAESYIEAVSLGPIAVKGFAAPTDVHELTGVGTARSRFQATALRGLSRFVGRDGEMALLDRALEDAGQGRGQLVAVVGEPGVGKSRLLWELTHSHRTQDWLVLESRSVSYGKGLALLPVVELLRSYFQIEERDTPRTTREKVIGRIVALDRRLDDCVTALLALLGVNADDPEWDRLESMARRMRSLQAVKRLLLREAQVQPVLFLLEDLHWVDTETQALLDALVDGIPTARFLLVVNYRPEYGHGWVNKACYRQIRLESLPPSSAETFLLSLLGPDLELAPVARLLIDRTGGNPLFLEESVRALVETKALTGERGAYHPALPVGDMQVPLTVQAILTARIDRLLPDDKRLLQVAAVIGKECTLSLLERVADIPESVVRGGVARLQAAEFIHETDLFPDIVYAFKHTLTHDVSYHSLLRDARRSMHANVVNALEHLYGDRTDQHINVLAHHAVQGEVWDRAYRYSRAAATQAVRRAAFLEGRGLLEQALATIAHLPRTTERDDQELETSLELWSACFETAQFTRLRDLERRIGLLGRELSKEPRLAAVLVRLAQGPWGRGQPRVVIETTSEVLRLAAPADVRTRGYGRFLAGAACRDLGLFAESIEHLRSGERVFEDIRADHEEALVLLPILVNLRAWQAETHAVVGRHVEAVEAAKGALTVARLIANDTALAFANAFLGYTWILHGDIAPGLPLLEQALASKQGHASKFAASFLAYALALDGHHKRAVEVVEANVGLVGPELSYLQTTRFRTMTVATYVLAGRAEDAFRELAYILPVARRGQAHGHLPTLLRLRAAALLHYASADLDEVEGCLEEARVLAAALGMKPEVAHCLSALGRVQLRAGNIQTGRDHLMSARALFGDLGMDYWCRAVEAEVNSA